MHMLSANSVDKSVEQWPTVYMERTLSCETRSQLFRTRVGSGLHVLLIYEVAGRWYSSSILEAV